MFARKTSKNKSAIPPMRAMAIVDGVLHATQSAMPVIQPDEVLVKVAYAAVNRADVMQVAGNYPPPEGASELPGLEVSGTIEAIGEEVIGWSVGEEVCALLSGGGYAEYVAVPAAQILTIPARVSLAHAASLPEGAATAFMALKLEAQLKKGERVLLHGGASGTGILIAQVARAWGAEVYATAGSEEKCILLRELGIHAINHHTTPFAAAVLAATQDEGVDVIIDILGAPVINTHLQLLRKGGRLVYLALMDGHMAESVKLSGILLKHLTVSGVTLRSRSPEEKADIIEGVRKTIWPQLAKGAITTVVDQHFPLEQAEKAHHRMQERLHLGKILLEVAPERSE